MPEKPSCPFCHSPRLALTHETELLRHYRCAYCHKQWGAARVTARPQRERDHIHPFPRWIQAESSE